MRLVLFILFGLLCTCARAQEERPPNFVIIFADDLGYGDLSSYGHPTIRTPNLDRMAREGQRWTSFYTAANICTPSRAALLTGRLPIRSGMISDKQGVLFPDSHEGLPAEEITLAELLQGAGYATAIIGKWHLGHRPAYLPTNHGFDYYFGIPYSNDMSKVSDRHWRDFWDVPRDSITPANFDVPLMRNTTEIERPADQHTITRRYTEESMQFIREHEDEPFFVYLAHNLPHVPLFASAEFTGRSERGIYGDVVEEIDHGIGRILDLLTERGLAENTVVVFTSDNGPWLSFGVDGGSAGPLYAGKGTTWEGGHRVPGIFWAPGRIEAGGMVSEMGSTLDLLPTFAGMAGVKVPDDRVIDGLDLAPTLLYGQPSPRDRMFFYRGTQVYAARLGAYKAHYATEGAFGQFGERVDHPTPLLYHLGIDPGESSDIADQFPGVVEEINAAVKAHREGVVPGRDRLVARGN
jgi:arylsulfatase A-like enzyme